MCSLCSKNRPDTTAPAFAGDTAMVSELEPGPLQSVAEAWETPLHSPCPAFDPPLESVLAAQVATCRHVPNQCRQEFADILGRLLFKVKAPTWEAMYALMVLPKLNLRAAARRGGAHQKQLALDIARRLELFRQGGFRDLWAEATRTSQTKKTTVRTRSGAARELEGDLHPGTVAVIRGLVEEGALAKAAKHFQQGRRG